LIDRRITMKVRIAGHALHPMLIALPLGLLVSSLAWDIVYLATGNPMWGTIAFWTIIGGLIGGVLAAIPGFVDWLDIPKGTRAKRIGWLHLVLNLALVALFALSAYLRWRTGYETPGVGQMVFGWIGLAIGTVSAWFGGELVERMGVAIHPNANLNAPSSLWRGGRSRDMAHREQH
jgi:uncharacterized membrane protein